MDYSQELYELAEEHNAWKILVPFPHLLFRWQIKHSLDSKRISIIASHRLGNHKFCEDKCKKVQEFLLTIPNMKRHMSLSMIA